MFPNFTLSIAALIAPHDSCPNTRISLAPDTLHPNSMLPKISSFTKFPATRAKKRSPIPLSNTSSTGIG